MTQRTAGRCGESGFHPVRGVESTPRRNPPSGKDKPGPTALLINYTQKHIQLAAKLFVHSPLFNIVSINSKTIVYTDLKFAQGKEYVMGNEKYNFQNKILF